MLSLDRVISTVASDALTMTGHASAGHVPGMPRSPPGHLREFRGSPDHFALRVAHSGTGVRRTVLHTWRVAGGLGLISLLIVFGPPRLVPWVLGACGLGALVAFVLLSRLPAPDARARAAAAEVAEEA